MVHENALPVCVGRIVRSRPSAARTTVETTSAFRIGPTSRRGGAVAPSIRAECSPGLAATAALRAAGRTRVQVVLTVTEVLPGVHRMWFPGIDNNAYLIEGNEATLVDCGPPKGGPKVLS